MDNREIPMTDTRISIPVCDKLITIDSTCDYTIPDYQPEATRILFVNATPTQPAKYVNANTAEFSGNIEYLVFYVGADGEIYSAPVGGEYGFELPIDPLFSQDFDNSLTACAEMYVENATARLIGPRKMNLKGKIKAHARAYSLANTRTLSPKTDDITLERLVETTPVMTVLHSISDTIDVSEEIIPEHEGIRIIGADSRTFVSGVICTKNKVNVKGELYLTLLVCESDNVGKVSAIERKIPINTDLEIEGLTPESKCTAYGTVGDVAVNMLDGRIVCDISVILTANAQVPRTLEYTKDMYSTKNECNTSYRSYPTINNGYCINGNFSMNERLIKKNISYPENANIIGAFGAAFANGLESNENKKTVNGQVKFTLLLDVDGEYMTNDVILPLRYEFDGCKDDISSADTTISVINCNVRQDAESISIDAELAVSAWGITYDDINVAYEINIGEEIHKNKGELVIYYLCPEDTVWSVAKKYHISRKELERKNKKLENVDYMII